MTTKRWLLLAATALAGLLLWLAFFPSDETMLRRSVTRMCELASRESGETTAATFGSMRALAMLMTQDAQAVAEAEGVTVEGREELVRHVAWAREQEDEASVSAEGLVIELLPGEDGDVRAARTTFVLRVLRKDQSAGTFDGTAATLTWAKVDGDWLMARAEVQVAND